MVSFFVSDTEILHGHRDYEQVVLDVNRSLKRFPPGISISLSYVYLPPAYEVRGKVMFSVCLSIAGGYPVASGTRFFPGREEGVPLVLSLVLTKVMFQVLPGGGEQEA